MLYEWYGLAADCSLPGSTIWTVQDRLYIFITSTIGVCFGLAQPCVERVIAHIIAWVSYGCRRLKQRLDAPDSDETTPLLGRARPARANATRNTSFCGVRPWCGFPPWFGLPPRASLAKLLSVLVLLASIAYAVAGAFVANLPSEKLARSGSANCGFWGLRDDANDAALDEDALIQGQRETRAGLYARNCYGHQENTDVDQCTIFANTSIDFSMTDKKECPFVDSRYCAKEGFSDSTAVRFSTGKVAAKHIGLNVQMSPTLNRTTVCVPLNMNGGFIYKLSDVSGNWGYDLGPVNSTEYSSNYTFEQPGDPFYYDVRAYTMRSVASDDAIYLAKTMLISRRSTYLHTYSKSSKQNYWQPVAGLYPRRELNTNSMPYSLTLMFINTCRIFYEYDSHDAIFPADRPWCPSGKTNCTDLWVNNDSRARPLACFDWVEVCDEAGDCSPSHTRSMEDDENVTLAKLAANTSITFDAITYRGASGLRAQEKIKDDTSLPLSESPTQWIEESRALFSTSLARIQYDVLDFANGVGRDKGPMYELKNPESSRSALCKGVVFKLPKDYDNISLLPTMAILIVPLLAWLLGVQTETFWAWALKIEAEAEFSDELQDSGYFDGLKLIRIERFIYWVRRRHAASRRSSSSPPSNVSQAGISSNASPPSVDVDSRPQNHGTSSAPVQAAAQAALSDAVTQNTAQMQTSAVGSPATPEHLQPPAATHIRQRLST